MTDSPQPGLPRERLTIDSSKVVHETMEGEVILIDLDTGDYYSLRGAGADVWELLERGSTAEAIASDVEGRYTHATDPAAIRSDVHDVLTRLHERRLIAAEPSGSGLPPGDARAEGSPPETRPYEPPVLERYTDMQEYLLIDPIHDVDERGWPVRKAASG